MSEEQVTGNGLEQPSAGTLLRQAREAAGLHVSTLAANLKVPVRKLEALEEDRYDQLPDAVFVRALASSVCRTLKVDPAPVLQRLPQTPQPRLAQMAESINTPFRAPGDAPHPGLLQQLSRPVVLTVVALLLGALVLVFLPWVQDAYETVVQANRPEPAPAPPVESSAPAPTPLEQPVAAAGGSAPVGSGAPAFSPAPEPAAPVPAPAPVAQASNSAAPSSVGGMQLRTSTSSAMPAAAAPGAAAASAAVGAAPPAGGIVVFRTRAASWVQVKDASGTTVMQRLMAPGEVAGATGTLPLSVTVGSAQSTEVQVRGRPFDLAPVARDNVARFEVK